MKIYKNDQEDKITEVKKIEKGVWIDLTNPNQKEISFIADKCNIPIEFLEDSLDLEESSRVQYDDEYNCTLIINDFPIINKEGDKIKSFITIPIGLIVTEDYIVTICSEEKKFLDKFIKKDPKIKTKNELILEILYCITIEYNKKLNLLNKQRMRIEKNIHDTLTNNDLYDLMEIEKSLVYFLTSLKATDRSLNKINRIKQLNLDEEEEYFLDEIKIENKQAIETTELYSKILDSITGSYSSLISNKLNNTMKTLTLITIFLTLPTIVFSFFGMNVILPISVGFDYSWVIILAVATVFIVVTTIFLYIRKILN